MLTNPLNPIHILISYFFKTPFKISLPLQKKKKKQRQGSGKKKPSEEVSKEDEGEITLVPVYCGADCTRVGGPPDRTRAAVRTADYQAGETRFLQQACLWAATVCSLNNGESRDGWLDLDLGFGARLNQTLR